ncbi:MAG TPA: tRNA (guanosine(46)-N7)-methyltransferase TrmB [Propionibacteriaceae bacterium]|nr:tRNA (guanosine(46)-N7)-methyltransferase TrmB [Propionibacteriaceae bacterium]
MNGAAPNTDDAPRVHRDVVSFVRRSARMRPPQRRAWDEHHDRLVLEVPRRETSTSVHPEARLDLRESFGRSAPLIVEIGPGPGESLVPMARARPEANVLAFEVYQPAIAQILGSLAAAGVENVRLISADAVAGMTHLLPPASVAELWTFFPDPWPKARHHKRRLLNAAFVELAVSRLEPGGRWRLATDWTDYAEAIRAALDDHPELIPDHERDWAPRPPDRPLTRFERRGLAAGRVVHDLSYRRAG